MNNTTDTRTIDNHKTIRVQVENPYIVPLLAAHCKEIYKGLGIDPIKNAPLELIKKMGIARKRFNNLLKHNEQPLLCEAVAYYDFMKDRGHIEKFSDLYKIR